jgi:hypothetical protein
MPFTPPAFANTNTLLVLIPVSGQTAPVLQKYAVRGATQTLKQIGDSSNVRRTVDGRLVDLTPPWFKQYASTVTCRDINSPCLDDAWRGVICEVHCAVELSYISGGSPTRPEVSGSSRIDELGITYYRPILMMMVLDIEDSFAEWESEYNWKIELQEVALP